MGAFSYHRFIVLLAGMARWQIYNRLVFACTVKTAIEVKWLCGLASKKRHSLFLFVCAAINRVNLAFRRTIIEDKHLTLAVIPFKVETNHPLIFLPLQKYEKKFAEFPFLLVYNSLEKTSGFS